ncbi:MAG: mechanosensitive ion channel family protein [Defluviitaleaceae bacterium]|nr:mechanosensitive ion channel family protein [Defluviitaleaceae bacterium]
MPQYVLTGEAFYWIAIRVAAVLLITVLATRIFRAIWFRWGKNTIHRKFIGNIISALITVIGTIFALILIPAFSTVVTALVAGSGIIALTIGLAAQESLGNAFNGLFISVARPFEVGDRVHLINADITGFIEDISIRHTIIRTFTNSRIIVPNSIMNKELIENSNICNPQASNFIDVIITYDSDVDKAMEIMAQAISSHPGFVDTRSSEAKETTPVVPVFVRALGLYGVELRASMWTATVATNFAACSDVRLAILRDFEVARIRIASSKIIDSLFQQQGT